MLPGKVYTPDDFGKIAWRRKWLIVVPWVLVVITTALIAHYQPDLYRSDTLILVVPQQVPQDYVRSTVTSRIEDRLNSINQQILSRTRLERIINDFNLYAKEREKGIMEDVVQRMRTKDIRIETLNRDAFRVSFIGDDPVAVMRVTDRLASLFIEENLKDRELLAESTNQFLGVQLEDARRRLIEQEKSLESYRARFSGELPSQADSNLQMVQNTQLQVQALVESINRDRDRRLLIERVRADERAAAAAGGADNGPAPEQPVAVQLTVAQQAYDSMALRLKPEHPDMIRMKRTIAGLQQRAEAEALATPLSPDANGGVADNTPRGNRARQLQIELEAIDRQIAAKRAEEARLRTVAATYQARLEAVPARETELAELTRDYSTLQTLYASLLTKSQESKIAANLERRQIGEQFKVLDPARIAEKPFSPDRVRLNLMGLVGGLFFGIVIAAFLEYRDSSFRTQDEVNSILGLPVLAQIPLISTVAERRWQTRRRIVLSTAGVAFLAVTGVAFWKIGVFYRLLR